MSNNQRRSGRSGNPAKRARAEVPASRRATLERASTPMLLTLHSLPRWIVPVALAIILFLGLLLSGQWAWLGAILLALVAAFVAWLSALSWPILSGGARLARVLVTAALVGMVVLKLLGRF